MSGPDDGYRTEHRREKENRQPDREREPDPERPRLRRLVDLVERTDRGADDARDLPDGQRGRDHEQPDGRGLEHAVHRLVDAGEHVGEDLRLDLRRDRRLPELFLVRRAEDAQKEERAGDAGDEGPQRDRARVGQQVVLVEQLDPEPDDLLEILPTEMHRAFSLPAMPTRKRRRKWGRLLWPWQPPPARSGTAEGPPLSESTARVRRPGSVGAFLTTRGRADRISLSRYAILRTSRPDRRLSDGRGGPRRRGPRPRPAPSEVTPARPIAKGVRSGPVSSAPRGGRAARGRGGARRGSGPACRSPRGACPRRPG